jgi:hypothetical protein
MTTSDTIIIHNFIEINNTLTFLPNSYLRIDSSGALCGHDTLIFKLDVKVDVYGLLECDIILSQGGRLDFYSTARVIWTHYAFLTIGGYLYNNGSINTTQWVNCIGKGNGIEDEELPDLNISFNSSTGRLSVEGYPNAEYIIVDMQGKIVFQSGTNQDSEWRKLNTGIYVVAVKCSNVLIRRKLFID